MTKFLVSAVALFAFAFGAQAASHAGGAPMKADPAASAASGAAMATSAPSKKMAKPAKGEKAEMKKDEVVKK